MTFRRALELCLVALFSIVGCSLLIDPGDGKMRCERPDGGAEVCPSGRECRGGYCQPPCAQLEICGDGVDNDCDGRTDQTDERETCGDGIDNDCDGASDEADPEAGETCGNDKDDDCDGRRDEGFDHDEDGFTWCGDTRDSMSGMASADCDDLNPMAYPRASEVCDGADNDCDHITDEQSQGAPPLCKGEQKCLDQRCVVPNCAIPNSGKTCGPGERCDSARQACVVAADCTASSCAADEYCDQVSKVCKKREPVANGALCLADDDCKSKRCIDAASLRFAEGTRVCGNACCDDTQCNADERCFASGTGARSCLPKSIVPTTFPPFCARDSVCIAPAVCALDASQKLESSPFASHSGVVTNACRAPVFGLGSLGDSCGGPLECNSNVCVPRKLLGQVCSTPCTKSADCQGFGQVAGLASSPTDVKCRYGPVTEGSAPDYASVCVIDRANENGSGAYGAECSSATDCADRGCVGATSEKKGRCTPTCCSDADCGPTLTGQPGSCRPYAFGTGYEMRCQL